MKPDKMHKQIDWNSVHHRLAAAQAALEREFEPPPAAQAAILRQRARALAQQPAKEPVAA